MADDNEQQGAIDTSDNSGAGPVAAPQQAGGVIDTTDNSGAGPVAAPAAQQQPDQQQEWPGGSQPQGPLAPVAKAVRGGIDAIRKMLAGEGALSPQLLDVVGQKVDPSGSMTPADRQVAAIHK